MDMSNFLFMDFSIRKEKIEEKIPLRDYFSSKLFEMNISIG